MRWGRITFNNQNTVPEWHRRFLLTSLLIGIYNVSAPEFGQLIDNEIKVGGTDSFKAQRAHYLGQLEAGARGFEYLLGPGNILSMVINSERNTAEACTSQAAFSKHLQATALFHELGFLLPPLRNYRRGSVPDPFAPDTFALVAATTPFSKATLDKNRQIPIPTAEEQARRVTEIEQILPASEVARPLIPGKTPYENAVLMVQGYLWSVRLENRRFILRRFAEKQSPLFPPAYIEETNRHLDRALSAALVCFPEDPVIQGLQQRLRDFPPPFTQETRELMAATTSSTYAIQAYLEWAYPQLTQPIEPSGFTQLLNHLLTYEQRAPIKETREALESALKRLDSGPGTEAERVAAALRDPNTQFIFSNLRPNASTMDIESARRHIRQGLALFYYITQVEPISWTQYIDLPEGSVPPITLPEPNLVLDMIEHIKALNLKTLSERALNQQFEAFAARFEPLLGKERMSLRRRFSIRRLLPPSSTRWTFLISRGSFPACFQVKIAPAKKRPWHGFLLRRKEDLKKVHSPRRR